MPHKKCDNPFFEPHTKTISVQTLSEAVRTKGNAAFPDISWDHVKKLCFNCRKKIITSYEQLLGQAAIKRLEIRHKVTKAGQSKPQSEPSSSRGLQSAVATSQRRTQFQPTETSTRGDTDQSTQASILSSGTDSQQSIGEASVVSTVATYVKQHSQEKTIQDINAIAALAGESPISKEIRHRASLIKKKYVGVKVGLKKKFEKATAGKVLLSPRQNESEDSYEETLKALVRALPKAKTKREKYLLMTCAPVRFGQTAIINAFGVSAFTAKRVVELRRDEGPFSAPSFSLGRKLLATTEKLVTDFYLQEEISRTSPAARETILVLQADGKKERVAKKRLLMNLKDLYALFMDENPGIEIGISKFAQLRPQNCNFPQLKSFHNQCVCQIHENFKLLLLDCNEGINVHEILLKLVCNQDEIKCAFSLCEDCPKLADLEKEFENIQSSENIEVYQWEKTDHTDMVKITLSFDQYKEKVMDYIPKIIEHDFINRQQTKYFQEVKTKITAESGTMMVQVDFAQNYSFIVQDAVQGHHWSNAQCTIHPFALTYWDKEQNGVITRHLVVISDELVHDADTFHYFRSKLIHYLQLELKEEMPTKIIYVSDGAASQYKNWKNFSNLVQHTSLYDGLEAEWHFCATSHGKSTCDGIGAVVKRSARVESLKGTLINAPMDLFIFCNRKLETSKLIFMFVSKGEVAESRQNSIKRYKKYKRVPGTRGYHSFIPGKDGVLIMRKVSGSGPDIKYNFLIQEKYFVKKEELIIGKYYAFIEANMYQVGILINIDEEDSSVHIDCFHINHETGAMKWPDSQILRYLPLRDILVIVRDPESNDCGVYKLRTSEKLLITERLNEIKKSSYISFLTSKF